MSKRAERRWRTSCIVEQRKFFAEKIYDGNIPEDRKGKVLGRCRTMHPYDCGKPNCGLCQYDKQCKIKKIQDIRSDIDFCEEISDILGHAQETPHDPSAGLPRSRRLR